MYKPLHALQVATVQGLSGTGSLRLGAAFIQRYMPGTKVFISSPTWGEYLVVSCKLEAAVVRSFVWFCDIHFFLTFCCFHFQEITKISSTMLVFPGQSIAILTLPLLVWTLKA